MSRQRAVRVIWMCPVSCARRDDRLRRRGGQAWGDDQPISAVEPTKAFAHSQAFAKLHETLGLHLQCETTDEGVAVVGYQTSRWAEQAGERGSRRFSTPAVRPFSARSHFRLHFISTTTSCDIATATPPTLDRKAGDAHDGLSRDGATQWRTFGHADDRPLRHPPPLAKPSVSSRYDEHHRIHPQLHRCRPLDSAQWHKLCSNLSADAACGK